MHTYDLLMTYLLQQGPIIGLFRFCLDNSLDYAWTHAQAKRAQQRCHVKITHATTRGRPDRLELTPRGRLYIQSILPGG